MRFNVSTICVGFCCDICSAALDPEDKLSQTGSPTPLFSIPSKHLSDHVLDDLEGLVRDINWLADTIPGEASSLPLPREKTTLRQHALQDPLWLTDSDTAIPHDMATSSNKWIGVYHGLSNLQPAVAKKR